MKADLYASRYDPFVHSVIDAWCLKQIDVCEIDNERVYNVCVYS